MDDRKIWKKKAKVLIKEIKQVKYKLKEKEHNFFKMRKYSREVKRIVTRNI